MALLGHRTATAEIYSGYVFTDGEKKGAAGCSFKFLLIFSIMVLYYGMLLLANRMIYRIYSLKFYHILF